jgi:hypothetical protein
MVKLSSRSGCDNRRDSAGEKERYGLDFPVVTVLEEEE